MFVFFGNYQKKVLILNFLWPCKIGVLLIQFNLYVSSAQILDLHRIYGYIFFGFTLLGSQIACLLYIICYFHFFGGNWEKKEYRIYVNILFHQTIHRYRHTHTHTENHISSSSLLEPHSIPNIIQINIKIILITV